MGRIENWLKRKLRTDCAFDGPGYYRMLSDTLLGEKNQQMNRIVYSQLAMETVGGIAHHLVKIFEDRKDENEDWKSMC